MRLGKLANRAARGGLVVIALLVQAGCAAAPRPEPSRCERHTPVAEQRFGAWHVAITKTPGCGGVDDLPTQHLTIRHRGRIVETLTAAGLGLGSYGFPEQPRTIRIGTDVTGDGVPNLVVTLWHGGNGRGTSETQVYGLADAGLMRFPRLPHDDASFFQDVDGRPGLELVTHDTVFAGWKAANARAPAGILVYRFGPGTLAEVAPDLMRATTATPRAVVRWAAEIHGDKDDYRARTTLAAMMVTLAYSDQQLAAHDLLQKAWRPSFADPPRCEWSPCTADPTSFWAAFQRELASSTAYPF